MGIRAINKLSLRGTISLAAVFAVAIGVVSSLSLPKVAAAEGVSVAPLTPQNQSYISGSTTFIMTVNGLSSSQSEPFWAVDNGTWNRMTVNANGQITATVDVTNWNWRSTNTYTLAFIALQKSNWQPIEKDITIHVGSAPQAAQTPVPVPVTPEPIVPAATLPSVIQPNTQPSKPLYVDPTADVNAQAAAWARSHPGDTAAGMNFLASQPESAWFGNWNNDVRSAADVYVSRAATANAVPVLVAYNIPDRDCGSYSAGGSQSASSYDNWIRDFASGIGKRQALVIVEPDAIAGMDCLSASGQTARLAMLSQAVTTLKQQTNATIYLDAGHPGWHSTEYMANKLKLAGISTADGFSLNVSNFNTNTDNISYGTKLSKLVGNTHFVIDTSRNGAGPTYDNQWCNPTGRAIGSSPTLHTNVPLVDAFLWVKGPGGSDGSCGASEGGTNAPVAGAWWPEYAVSLLRNTGRWDN